MSDIAIYPVTLAERDETYLVDVSEDENIVISMDSSIQIINTETYQGDYVITPQTEMVTLETEGLAMSQNIIINPIPSNYGLITWDGSVLTVS